ncbi:MAG: response regulator transcription factor [Tissierellia bacterium]|nr:response regulator transcription factor [Tissierellia bacterium]
MQGYTILVCEDEKAISQLIKIALEKQDYKVIQVFNGEDALKKFQSEKKIDLVIMDLMMPKLSGEEVIVKIREDSYCPIIIVSAKAENFNKVIGLNLGADDYLTKPFNEIELVARVNSLIRRTHDYSENTKKDDDTLTIDGISLSLTQKCVFVDGVRKNLTSIEFKILKLLMENPESVFSTDEIYEYVWKEPALDTKTVSVHIKRIRDKIEIDPKNPRYILVSWGLGYKFVKPKARQ